MLNNSAASGLPRRSTLAPSSMVASIGRQSLSHRLSSIGYSAKDMKDPRPVRDKQYQVRIIQSILEFLAAEGYNMPVTPRTLQQPTKKDFENIFKFIYARLDPQYQYAKKFEEDVILILKSLKYPFADSISKSQLFAVGSQHSWPGILAMLHWLSELAMAANEVELELESLFKQQNVSGDMMEDDVGLDNPEVRFFSWSSSMFLIKHTGTADDLDRMQLDLERNNAQQRELVQNDTARLANEKQQLLDQIRHIESSVSPLVACEQMHATLMEDKAKVEGLIRAQEQRQAQMKSEIHETEANIQESEVNVEKLREELQTVQSIVDAQELSPQDVERMTTERQQLMTTLESLKTRREQAEQTGWDMEVAVQRKIYEIEKSIVAYKQHVYQLGLVPLETSPIANGVQYDLEFNPRANTLRDMVSVDIVNVIKPALNALRHTFVTTTAKLVEESLAVQQQNDACSEQILEAVDSIQSWEKEIAKLNGDYLHAKEAYEQQFKQMTSMHEKLDAEMQSSRLKALSEKMEWEQKAQKAQLLLEETAKTIRDAKQRAHQQVIKDLEEMLAFKQHIETTLADLQRLVGEELAIAGAQSQELNTWLGDVIQRTQRVESQLR
ncbi:kinetochore-associated Ndc80 complex subunit ndc80 [Sorochytrium milnesiophthora]